MARIRTVEELKPILPSDLKPWTVNHLAILALLFAEQVTGREWQTDPLARMIVERVNAVLDDEDNGKST